MRTVVLASDHAGFKIKEAVRKALIEGKSSWKVLDVGSYTEETTDYPIFAKKAAEMVQKRQAELGIVVCGTGNGVAIVSNKCKGIRCALAWNKELARLARAHNDANMLALPGRFITEEEAIEIVDQFLDTPFEGGRHERRVSMIESGC
ncbi:MAG: ribose 5-phosphate isomerase B [Flavobacteriales bacterium]|nr:ribose 5-phosphate isomerase B [Flavobacteriales bacterium]